MPDLEDAIDDCKDAHKLTIAEVLNAAHQQPCSNADEKRQTEGLIQIMKAYFQETVDIANALKKAGEILQNKLKEYESKNKRDWSDF